MEVSSIYLNIGKSVLALALPLFIISQFPQPAFGGCFPDNNSLVCSDWLNILSGLVFALTSYYLGPKINYHYYLSLVIFILIGSVDNIRSGLELREVLSDIPFQSFYYGGIIGLIFITIVKALKKDWSKSVPNKSLKRD